MYQIMEEHSIEIVPWFSWAEWKDVYQGIFSNDIEDNRQAYHQICVWKSRVPKLPLGIESTVPLLHAKIAQLDHNLDVSFKNSLLNLAIMKFVSLATKSIGLNQKTWGSGQRNAAHSVNLPPYLIDIRNCIVHSDVEFGTSMTLKSTFDTAFDWIKVNYWEAEEEKREKAVCDSTNDLNNKKKTTKNGDVQESTQEDSEESQEESKSNAILRQQFRKCCIGWRTTHQREDEEPLKVTMLYHDRMIMKVEREIRSEFSRNSQQCMDAVADEFLFGEYALPLLKDTKQNNGSSRCSCALPLTRKVLKDVKDIFLLMRKLNALQRFLVTIISKHKVSPELCVFWLNVFVNSILVARNQTPKCDRHVFKLSLIRSSLFVKKVDWRSIVYELFCLGEATASKLAVELCKLKFTKIGSKRTKALEKLANTFLAEDLNASKKPKRERRVSDVQLNLKEVHGLQSVIKESKKASKPVNTNIQSLLDYSKPNQEDLPPSELPETVLGLLPHQKYDPKFYRQLILKPSEHP